MTWVWIQFCQCRIERNSVWGSALRLISFNLNQIAHSYPIANEFVFLKQNEVFSSPRYHFLFFKCYIVSNHSILLYCGCHPWGRLTLLYLFHFLVFRFLINDLDERNWVISKISSHSLFLKVFPKMLYWNENVILPFFILMCCYQYFCSHWVYTAVFIHSSISISFLGHRFAAICVLCWSLLFQSLVGLILPNGRCNILALESNNLSANFHTLMYCSRQNIESPSLLLYWIIIQMKWQHTAVHLDPC